MMHAINIEKCEDNGSILHHRANQRALGGLYTVLGCSDGTTLLLWTLHNKADFSNCGRHGLPCPLLASYSKLSIDIELYVGISILY